MSGAEAGFVPTESTLLDVILEPGRLAVVFQPIFQVGEGTPVLHAVESLIRGPKSTNAERPAVLFEYVRRKRAEAIVDRACIAAVLERARALPETTLLSMNVHASTLGRDAGFPTFLLERARAAEIAARRLIVEIVEHSPPLDVPSFRGALGALREAGVSIALDDVGLGQSNYKMILDVRPDIYKLDRYLVSGASNDPYRQVILDSLARMVRRLEARAVAEGVETHEELEAVQAAGIDLVQGFYFSRPLTYEDLVATGYLAGRAPVALPA
jgi:EAL domain-containing protein (putative c-di-GMP-specific phosphodiesterase class I)